MRFFIFPSVFVGVGASFCAETTLIASSLSAALLTAKDQMASGRTRAHTPFPINEEGKKRRVKSDGMGGGLLSTLRFGLVVEGAENGICANNACFPRIFANNKTAKKNRVNTSLRERSLFLTALSFSSLN